MPSVLDPELRTYRARKAELLGMAEGKWVLIHEGEILGTFESQIDAINAGYQQLGNVPFLVKRVTQVESPVTFSSNLLAI